MIIKVKYEDLGIWEESARKETLDFVMESKTLRQKLTFQEQVKMADWVMKDITKEELFSVIFDDPSILEKDGWKLFEKKVKNDEVLVELIGKVVKVGAKVGFVAAKTVAKHPIYTVAFMVLFSKLKNPCWRECLSKFGQGSARKLCRANCESKAIKSVLQKIRASKGQCRRTDRPEKCLAKIARVEQKWQKKLRIVIQKSVKFKTKSAAKSF